MIKNIPCFVSACRGIGLGDSSAAGLHRRLMFAGSRLTHTRSRRRSRRLSLVRVLRLAGVAYHALRLIVDNRFDCVCEQHLALAAP